MIERNERVKALMVAVMLVVLVLSVVPLILKGMIQQNEDLEKYNQEEKVEYIKMFGTRNKDYKDQTQEDLIQIILEFSDDDLKESNIAVMNYLSNVNGKLLSINGKSVSKNTINPVVGGVYGEKTGFGLGLGLTNDTDVTTKNVYVLLVPKDAKFADNLQERMDRYFKYRDKKNIFL